MDITTFTAELERLSDDDWLRVASGAAVLMVDDQALAIGPAAGSYVVVDPPDGAPVEAAALRRECLKDVQGLLANYYFNHPLSPAGFNRQLRRLLDEHGAAAFAAPPDRMPRFTLFVEDGRVLAESADSPRHRYGAYCELEGALAEAALVKEVEDWLRQGEAYERYLAMNVCRYNC